jgi:hypothetical protein
MLHIPTLKKGRKTGEETAWKRWKRTGKLPAGCGRQQQPTCGRSYDAERKVPAKSKPKKKRGKKRGVITEGVGLDVGVVVGIING